MLSHSKEHELFDIGLAHMEVPTTPTVVIGRVTNEEALRPASSATGPKPPALTRCALLLYAGLAGAAMFVAGLLQLVDIELRGGTALALVLGGGVLAVRCWQEARTAIDETETDRPRRPRRAGRKCSEGWNE